MLLAALALGSLACTQPPSRFGKDPCAIITKPEAEAAMGRSVSPVPFQERPDAGTPYCRYGHDSSGELGVVVNIYETERPEVVWDRWLIEGSAVPELDARSAWDPRRDKLYVIRGHFLLSFEIRNAPTPGQGKAIGVQMAKAALLRVSTDAQK